MALTVIVRDETPDGKTLRELCVELLTERLTARELIRSRVYQEVQDRGGDVDWRAEFEVALRAFESNGFFLIVGDEQVTELEHQLVVGPDTRVTFLRLVPLVGG